MYRITRTSQIPAAPLEIVFFEPISAGKIDATAATPDGPTYSEVVADDVAEHILADEGLSKHFSVEPLNGQAGKAPKKARRATKKVQDYVMDGSDEPAAPSDEPAAPEAHGSGDEA
jgi:hypothetical protein